MPALLLLSMHADIKSEVIVAKPIVAKPIIAKPLVIKPIVAAKPIEPKPIMVRPVFAKPIEPKPLVAKPAIIEPKPIQPIAAKSAPIIAAKQMVTPDTPTVETITMPLAFPIEIINESKTAAELNSIDLEYSVDGVHNADLTKQYSQKTIHYKQKAVIDTIAIPSIQSTASPTFEGLTGITINNQLITIKPKRMTRLKLYINNKNGSWSIDEHKTKAEPKKVQKKMVKAVATTMLTTKK